MTELTYCAMIDAHMIIINDAWEFYLRPLLQNLRYVHIHIAT